MPDTAIRILELEPFFTYETPREPLKFGAVVMTASTLCYVRARVETRDGKRADGWGAIFMSDVWAFPTPSMSHEVKDAAMRHLVERFCRHAASYPGYGHPIDIFLELEKDLARIAAEVSRDDQLVEPLPFLAALVCASPVDAALHDAFGIVHGLSSYATYGPDFMPHDLSAYLGPRFRGRYLSDFVRPDPAPEVPIWHLVGGLDRLTADGGSNRAPDGRPATLDEWIRQDGLFCLKVKLRGSDLAWDLDRLLAVHRIGRSVLDAEGRDRLYMSADTNEQCESPAYMVELLHKLREGSPQAYDALLYVEQPTERDLRAHRYDMRELSALKPVAIDESLTSLEDLELALELGWSAVALKTCKCQSLALLEGAVCEERDIKYSIQDLTNPGLALLHSVGFGAHLRPMMGVEANARQYFPDTSLPESQVHPDITGIRDGVARTGTLRGPGLGYQVDAIPRDIFHASHPGEGEGR